MEEILKYANHAKRAPININLGLYPKQLLLMYHKKLSQFFFTPNCSTGCLKKNWVLPNWSFADPSGGWWEILVTFSANLVEPVKSRAVGLVHVRIMLINHFYLCGFWYHELSWLLKIYLMIPICQTLNKRIEIDNSKHDSTGFATKITSISHQPPAGSANAQFDKSQFFWDTLYILPVGKVVEIIPMNKYERQNQPQKP